MKRTEIINATTPLLIDVPVQLTKSTRRKNSYHCVFAEACNRIPHVKEAIIHISTAYLLFEGEDHFRRYKVRTTLRDQIITFDRFGVFDPGQYILGVVQPSHQASGKRQGGPTTAPPVRTTESYRRKPVPLKGIRAPAKLAAL